MDYVRSRATANNLPAGKIVVLPSTFQGSPRAMQQGYQDAMTIVAKFGRPDLFLTFTCNPKWKEITENLTTGRLHKILDLIAWVFKRYLDQLMKDITRNHILGKALAFVNVVEFQKRGLPHCHLLIVLDPESKLRDAADIDLAISAEIPDPVTR